MEDMKDDLEKRARRLARRLKEEEDAKEDERSKHEAEILAVRNQVIATAHEFTALQISPLEQRHTAEVSNTLSDATRRFFRLIAPQGTLEGFRSKCVLFRFLLCELVETAPQTLGAPGTGWKRAQLLPVHAKHKAASTASSCRPPRTTTCLGAPVGRISRRASSFHHLCT